MGECCLAVDDVDQAAPTSQRLHQPEVLVMAAVGHLDQACLLSVDSEQLRIEVSGASHDEHRKRVGFDARESG